MNQLSNLNATQVRQVQYNASLLPNSTTINFTVYSCSVNCFVQQLIIYLASPQPGLGTNINVSILDRGNGYSGILNGNYPITYTTIGTSDVISPSVQATTSQIINQNGTVITVNVLQSVADSEGLGNIYIQMNALNGYTFNTNFNMDVVFRPEITYNKRLDNINQLSAIKPYRVLSGPGSYNGNNLSVIMTEQTNAVSHAANDRLNTEVATYGFNVGSTSPYFYFGNNSQNRRWYINFSSDNQPNIGIVTFSYFNGAGFVPFLATQVSNGCLGPGTYNFAYGGVVIFTPPPSWAALQMVNDPIVQFNKVNIGLGTLGVIGQTVRGSGMNWIQCQVGFVGLGSINVSTIIPLIDPQYNINTRRTLI